MRAQPLGQGTCKTETIRLQTLGCFEITRGDDTLTLPIPAQRLAVLLGIRGEPVGRSYAGGILWPEVEHDHALANLRTALWRLQHLAPGMVSTAGSGLRASPDVAIDLRQSESLAERILSDRLDREDAPAASASLCADLLPDWDDEWLDFERERFRDLRIHALERLSEYLSSLGKHAQAVQAGLWAVQAEPLRESAHRALMRAYVAEGNQARALQVFRTLEHQLDAELQVTPSQATIDLALELVGPRPLGVASVASEINVSR